MCIRDSPNKVEKDDTPQPFSKNFDQFCNSSGFVFDMSLSTAVEMCIRDRLSISTVLGVIGVVAAFGLFYLAERVFHMDRLTAQTLMYLKLSVAGHLTIFLTRTRGPFWSIRPAKILWMAVLGTQTIATLIAVYGLFMTPLGWKWAGFVWAYAIAWALINDRIKLLAYKIFDPVKAEPKADTKGETKDEPKPETKVDALKPDAKPDAPAPEACLLYTSSPLQNGSSVSRLARHSRLIVAS